MDLGSIVDLGSKTGADLETADKEAAGEMAAEEMAAGALATGEGGGDGEEIATREAAEETEGDELPEGENDLRRFCFPMRRGGPAEPGERRSRRRWRRRRLEEKETTFRPLEREKKLDNYLLCLSITFLHIS